MRAGDVLPHPLNPKIHPPSQNEALTGLLEDVGKCDILKAYRSEREGGKLVFFDGHARQGLKPDEIWNVGIYDVTDDEADKLLLTFDPIAQEAQASQAKLEMLLHRTSSGNAAVMEFLAKQAERAGIVPPVEKESSEEDTGAQIGSLEYRVIVICESEAQQAELLERFESEGLKCQALIS